MLSSFYKMQAQRMTALHTFAMMLRNSMTVSLLMLLIWLRKCWRYLQDWVMFWQRHIWTTPLLFELLKGILEKRSMLMERGKALWQPVMLSTFGIQWWSWPWGARIWCIRWSMWSSTSLLIILVAVMWMIATTWCVECPSWMRPMEFLAIYRFVQE